MSQLNITSKFAIASLTLALTACGGSNSTPTKPNIIPNANTQQGAKAEEAKKAEEARKAEELRTKPHNFQAKSFLVTTTNKDFDSKKFFAPVLDVKTDLWTGNKTDPLDKIVAANGMGQQRSLQELSLTENVNGQITNINATYETYSYHLADSAIAVIRGYGTYNGKSVEDFAYAYSGRATNANELDTLKGTATYQGQAYFDGNKKLTANLLANFDNKKVSGHLTAPKMNVALKETAITKTADKKIGFVGKATYTYENLGAFNGTYEGVFMGRGAKEVAGQVNIPDRSGENIGGVFNATKQ